MSNVRIDHIAFLTPGNYPGEDASPGFERTLELFRAGEALGYDSRGSGNAISSAPYRRPPRFSRRRASRLTGESPPQPDAIDMTFHRMARVIEVGDGPDAAGHAAPSISLQLDRT
ncbi:hypothetical protein [Burkholderia cepacia]|uniref:hypothetical protein n=1 Tax=Burkholderia cepacia TaxID=292 RepID=UPI0039BFB3CE